MNIVFDQPLYLLLSIIEGERGRKGEERGKEEERGKGKERGWGL